MRRTIIALAAIIALVAITGCGSGQAQSSVASETTTRQTLTEVAWFNNDDEAELAAGIITVPEQYYQEELSYSVWHNESTDDLFLDVYAPNLSTTPSYGSLGPQAQYYRATYTNADGSTVDVTCHYVNYLGKLAGLAAKDDLVGQIIWCGAGSAQHYPELDCYKVMVRATQDYLGDDARYEYLCKQNHLTSIEFGEAGNAEGFGVAVIL